MAPALAAVIIVFYNYSPKRIKNILKKKYFVNINYRYCLIAFFIPMGLLSFSKVITIIYENKNMARLHLIVNYAKYRLYFQ